jgi:hypothetical protein
MMALWYKIQNAVEPRIAKIFTDCIFLELLTFSTLLSFVVVYPREHAMLQLVYNLLCCGGGGGGGGGVSGGVVALLNYCEFRHGCTSSRLLRILSWLHFG